VIAALRRRGHDVEVTEPWSLGRISAIAREPDGLLRAAANPRGMQGYAVGR
jgi:gamma-glutamyltranspeptidase / glutathione hydrolase